MLLTCVYSATRIIGRALEEKFCVGIDRTLQIMYKGTCFTHVKRAWKSTSVNTGKQINYIDIGLTTFYSIFPLVFRFELQTYKNSIFDEGTSFLWNPSLMIPYIGFFACLRGVFFFLEKDVWSHMTPDYICMWTLLVFIHSYNCLLSIIPHPQSAECPNNIMIL